MFRLLGADAFPLRRSLEVLQPLAAGDTLTARAEVTAVDAAQQQVTLKLEAYNGAGEVVVQGTSVETMDIRK